MSSQLQTYRENAEGLDIKWIEQVILQLADAFDIRVRMSVECDKAVVTGALAFAGGLLGGFAGGRLGAALGASIGGFTGLRVSIEFSLRQIWDTVKEKLTELFYIVFDYLRSLDPVDYKCAFDVLMACPAGKRELVLAIIKVLAVKIGEKVIKITASIDNESYCSYSNKVISQNF